MYEYKPKSDVYKTQNMNLTPARRINAYRFENFSSNQKSKNGISFLNEKTHDKIFRKPCADVVQRTLSTEGLLYKKHGNIIAAREMWNSIFGKLLNILPTEQQVTFRNAVNTYENGRFNDQYAIPSDEDYAVMASRFADIATEFINSPHSFGSVTEAASNAGGSVHTANNTGGHKNTHTRIAIQTVGGGTEFFSTGETREHGKQVSKKKQHQKESEKNSGKDALCVERISIATQVNNVYQILLENNMICAANILRRFISNLS